MGTRLVTMILVVAVLTLLLPFTQTRLEVEQAFTIDNLVQIEMPAD